MTHQFTRLAATGVALGALLACHASPPSGAVRAPESGVRDLSSAFALDDSIPRWMADAHVPALAIAVLDGGRVTSTRTFGVGRPGRMLDTTALWNVASLTKPVVAVTTLRYLDGGAFSLDDPVDRWWIDPDVRDDPRHALLTARLIMSHQTGFPNWRWSLPGEKLAFQAAPGAKLGYSGEGFEYLRHVLEHRSGGSLQHLADSLVFAPLGMRETTFGWNPEADPGRLVAAHDTAGAALAITPRPMSRANAADWLVTTIGDYARFAASVLHGAGLAPATYAEMTRAQVAFDGKPNEAMGLGWEVMRGPVTDPTILLHSGSDPGIKTIVILLPASRRGLVLFLNGERGMDVVLRIIKAHFAIRELTG